MTIRPLNGLIRFAEILILLLSMVSLSVLTPAQADWQGRGRDDRGGDYCPYGHPYGYDIDHWHDGHWAHGWHDG